MLRSHLVGAGLSSVALLCATLYGCDGDTETPSSEFAPGRQPPAEPAGAPPASGPGAALAVRKLFLGNTDRNESPSNTAWQEFGYNLDGLVSTAGSPNHCQPQAGGSPKVMDDGKEGIDNAFGKSLMPLIINLASDAQDQINESLEEASFSIIVDMTTLGPEENQINLLSRLYAGTGLEDDMAIPRWDGTDGWLVAPELLTMPSDITTSKVTFENAYVNNNTWVSGTPGNLDLSIAVAGYSLTLTITKAVITMDLDGQRTGATNGVIAGILETEALIDEIRKVAGSFSPEFCSGSTIESLLDNLRRASDIPIDGVQAPDKTCDGISIGLGFNSTKVVLAGVDEPAMGGPGDPCNAAGAGGEGGEAPGGAGGTGGSGGEGGAAGGAGGEGGA
jgi:hypothetical protein